MSKFIVQISVLALVFWLEGVWPFFLGRRDRIRHALPNIILGSLNGWLTSLFVAVAAVWVIGWAEYAGFGLFNILVWPEWVEFVCAFVLFDLWMYLWHVANHKIPFLWLFHRAHHSDLEMDATTALRFHTGEILFSSVLRLGIFALLGMRLEQVLVYELCLNPVIIFHHSNLALPEKYDRLLRAVIVTPNMHRVHHSEIREETDSNYASIFSFWDRLMKTFTRRETRTIRFGLGYLKAPRWQRVWGLLLTPLAGPRPE